MSTDHTGIVLRAENLHWLGDTPDQQAHDPCAHGDATFAIGENRYVWPSDDGDVNVTGAGLFLLRTLSYSNASPDWVVTNGGANLMFPHCANPYAVSDEFDFAVFVDGCASGFDVEVIRDGASVVVQTSHIRGDIVSVVDAGAWLDAVLAFCDAVEEFYNASPARLSLRDEDADWAAFWQEWHDRKRMARRNAAAEPDPAPRCL